MMPTLFKLLLSIVAILLLSGCRENKLKRMPDTLPDIRGNITNLSRSNESDENATVSILVKAMNGIEVNVVEANIRVTEETLIEDSKGEILSTAALLNGQEVEVWLAPEMMESLPVQADAIAIRIPDQE